jgi:hypothetical protein
MTLSVRDCMTLDHAAQLRDTAAWHTWRREVLGYRTPTAFYAALLRLLDEPAALEYRPDVVYRQQRLRDRRREARSVRV